MLHAGPDDVSDAGPVERADIVAATRLARHHRNPALRAVTAFGQLADQPPLLAASGAVVAWGLLVGDRRLARRGGHLVAAVALATLLKGRVKRALSRTRPNVLLEEGVYRVEPLGPDEGPWHSFPSGHMAGGMALARAVARCWPGARLPAYAGAVAVGVVQVPRGAHYPSDVLAGAAIGIAAEAVVNRLFPPPVPAPSGPSAGRRGPAVPVGRRDREPGYPERTVSGDAKGSRAREPRLAGYVPPGFRSYRILSTSLRPTSCRLRS